MADSKYKDPVAILVGNMGKDFSLGTSKSGDKEFMKSSIACVSPANGETVWVELVCFEDKAFETLAALNKGARICVRGPIKFREYEGKTYSNLVIWNLFELEESLPF